MIEFVKTEAVLPLRSAVLRNGNPLQECIFAGDGEAETFHLADVEKGQIICVATFHFCRHPKYNGNAYQLRGMATTAGHRGKGVGNRLLNFGIVYLRGKHIDYVWCNARKAAYSFYLSQGFEFISEESEVEGIGPHKTMYLKLR